MPNENLRDDIHQRFDRVDARLQKVDERLEHHEMAIFGGITDGGATFTGLQAKVENALEQVRKTSDTINEIRDMMKSAAKWFATGSIALVCTAVSVSGTVIWFFMTHAEIIAKAIAALAAATK